jgi:hypothetical protein
MRCRIGDHPGVACGHGRADDLPEHPRIPGRRPPLAWTVERHADPSSDLAAASGETPPERSHTSDNDPPSLERSFSCLAHACSTMRASTISFIVQGCITCTPLARPSALPKSRKRWQARF